MTINTPANNAKCHNGSNIINRLKIIRSEYEKSQTRLIADYERKKSALLEDLETVLESVAAKCMFSSKDAIELLDAKFPGHDCEIAEHAGKFQIIVDGYVLSELNVKE